MTLTVHTALGDGWALASTISAAFHQRSTYLAAYGALLPESDPLIYLQAGFAEPFDLISKRRPDGHASTKSPSAPRATVARVLLQALTNGSAAGRRQPATLAVSVPSPNSARYAVRNRPLRGGQGPATEPQTGPWNNTLSTAAIAPTNSPGFRAAIPSPASASPSPKLLGLDLTLETIWYHPDDWTRCG